MTERDEGREPAAGWRCPDCKISGDHFRSHCPECDRRLYTHPQRDDHPPDGFERGRGGEIWALNEAAEITQEQWEGLRRKIGLESIEQGLRGLHDCFVVNGERRISIGGLRKSLVNVYRPVPRDMPHGKAGCSCCGDLFSRIIEWNTLQICEGCWLIASAPS